MRWEMGELDTWFLFLRFVIAPWVEASIFRHIAFEDW